MATQRVAPPGGEQYRPLANMAEKRRGTYGDAAPTIMVEPETPSSGSPSNAATLTEVNEVNYCPMDIAPTSNGGSRGTAAYTTYPYCSSCVYTTYVKY